MDLALLEHLTPWLFHRLQAKVDAIRAAHAGFSRNLAMYRASAAREDTMYNLARPLKTLRIEVHDVPGQRWLPRTPAMAAGLAEHIWSVKELLTTVVLPNT